MSGIAFLTTSVISGFLVGLGGMPCVLVAGPGADRRGLACTCRRPDPGAGAEPAADGGDRTVDLRGTFA